VPIRTYVSANNISQCYMSNRD